jgi:aminoglycoside N3'-acetyltransferase
MVRTRTQLERARIVFRGIREACALRPPPTGHPISYEVLRAALADLGVTRGTMLHVQSSLTHLYRGSLTEWQGQKPAPARYALDVVDLLIDVVGPEGTIVMNTDGLSRRDVQRAWAGQLPTDRALFDAARTPSSRGLIAEVFRRRPDVLRSVHPWYNMAAWGAMSPELINEHHLSAPYTMDEHSPTCKLTFGGGKVLLLGQGYGGNVPLHLVEYLHPEEYPRPIFVNKSVPMSYVDRDGATRLIDVMLHASGWYISAPETIRFCAHMQTKYGLYRSERFANGTEVICYDAREQYEATRREMSEGVTLYDPEFK